MLPRPPTNFKCSYVFVLCVAQQPQFPVGPFGVDEGLEWTIQLLDGHHLLALLVHGRTKSQTQWRGQETQADS